MEHAYANRFVGFVDILGFKQMIADIESRSSGHRELYKRLQSVLNFLSNESVESNGQHDLPIYELTNGGMIERELGNPRITYVSDCAIISTDDNFDGFKSLCNKLTKLSTDLACDGMFLRGAITYGPLYHDGKFVFGSAYQRAYEIESTIANSPRILVDQTALDFLKEHEGQFPLTDFGSRIDADGHRYLHPFPWLYHPHYTFDWIGFLLRVKGHILFSLNRYDSRVAGFPDALKSLDIYYCWREFVCSTPNFTGANSKVLEKYFWLKDEFNRTLAQYGDYLLNESGTQRISRIVDHGSHWGPEYILGRQR